MGPVPCALRAATLKTYVVPLVSPVNDWVVAVELNVRTPDVIKTWIDYKTEREIDQVQLRPHPWEFYLYYNIRRRVVDLPEEAVCLWLLRRPACSTYSRQRRPRFPTVSLSDRGISWARGVLAHGRYLSLRVVSWSRSCRWRSQSL